MSKIALNIRLAVQDMIMIDKRETLINLRAYVNDNLDKNEEFNNFTRQAYFHHGNSGTHGNIPAFQRMLEDVKNIDIQTIIVDPFSRFMRYCITLADYLETIFPFFGVSFLAINADYDCH